MGSRVSVFRSQPAANLHSAPLVCNFPPGIGGPQPEDQLSASGPRSKSLPEIFAPGKIRFKLPRSDESEAGEGIGAAGALECGRF